MARERRRFGVSDGTYYAMRRKAEAAGISPKDFDRIAKNQGYDAAKAAAREVRNLPIDKPLRGTARDVVRDVKLTGDWGFPKENLSAADRQLLASLLSGERRLPGSTGSDKRTKAWKQLAAKIADAGGDPGEFFAKLGSPKSGAKVASFGG